ncbi:MAG: hypothetical protein ACJAVM_001636 [Sulfitobacter sp.]
MRHWKVSFVDREIKAHVCIKSNADKFYQAERINAMIEATTNPAARNVMKQAHEERAAAMQDAWAWLMGKVSR